MVPSWRQHEKPLQLRLCWNPELSLSRRGLTCLGTGWAKHNPLNEDLTYGMFRELITKLQGLALQVCQSNTTL